MTVLVVVLAAIVAAMIIVLGVVMRIRDLARDRHVWRTGWELAQTELEAERDTRTARDGWQAAYTYAVDELQDVLAPALDPATAAALRAEVKVEPALPGLPPTITTVWDQRVCQHCGGLHSRACPRVRRIAYGTDHKPVEVEFWPDGRWPTDGVIWLEDVIAAAALHTDSGEVSGQE